MLAVSGVTKGFPAPDDESIHTVLKDIRLLLRDSDRVGMIGPNGAGKTVLLRVILGELEPDLGEIVIGA